jgi:hypothetical protein
VQMCVERGISERMACRAVGLKRSSYQCKSKNSLHQRQQEGLRIRAEIVELAHKHRRTDTGGLRHSYGEAA